MIRLLFERPLWLPWRDWIRVARADLRGESGGVALVQVRLEGDGGVMAARWGAVVRWTGQGLVTRGFRWEGGEGPREARRCPVLLEHAARLSHVCTCACADTVRSHLYLQFQASAADSSVNVLLHPVTAHFSFGCDTGVTSSTYLKRTISK